jgi:hypothetical protein
VLQLGAGLLGSQLFRAHSLAAPESKRVRPSATVTGPVSGGRHGGPFGASVGDIAQQGYVEEEYFISGEAQRYEPIGALTADGKWNVQPAATAPFKTRILVRRPKNAARFTGTVVVEWTNVSAGYELSSADPPGLYEGHAYVAVSAQYVGLHGFRNATPHGLVQWDSQRYGSLSHPGDSYSYDIFSQVARVIGPMRHKTGVDPMGGLAVKRLIAVGGSQSAARLCSYINAVQPRERIFDAFVPFISFGYGTNFDDAILDLSQVEPAKHAQVLARMWTQTRLRDDADARVIVVNSEAEVLANFPVRQLDTPKFRCWEVAGAAHAPTSLLKLFSDQLVRDGLSSLVNPKHHASDVMWRPSYDAALWHVHRWLSGGPAPPSQPPVEVIAGNTPTIDRDVYGNAKGGIRLPELEVPIARYQGRDDRRGGGGLSGLTEPFTGEILAALYAAHEDYAAKIDTAARSAEAAGVILPYRTQEYIDQARTAPIPA